MSEPVKRLSMVNWVVVGAIIAIGCAVVVYISQAYKPGDVGPDGDQPVATPAPALNPGEVPPEAILEMIENPPEELYAGLREVEAGQIEDLEPLIKWRRQLGEVRSLATAADGGVYVLTEAGMLYALDPAGEVRWAKTFSGSLLNGPLVDESGNVFIAERRKVWSFTAGGDERWQYAVTGVVYGGIVLDSKGNLVVKEARGKTDTEYLTAIDPEGAEKWSYTAEYEFAQIPPRAGTKGRVYDMGRGGVFQTLTHVGTRGWGLGLHDKARGPATDSRGLLYLAATPDPEVPWEWILMCLEPQMGKEVWHVELPNYPQFGPVATPDGRAYIACKSEKSNGLLPYPVLAFDKQGELLWSAGFLSVVGLVVPDDPQLPLAVVSYDGAHLLTPGGEPMFSLNYEAGHPKPLLITADSTMYGDAAGTFMALDLANYRP